eukprot:2295-Heterococcus_DN1.PRE.1
MFTAQNVASSNACVEPLMLMHQQLRQSDVPTRHTTALQQDTSRPAAVTAAQWHNHYPLSSKTTTKK